MAIMTRNDLKTTSTYKQMMEDERKSPGFSKKKPISFTSQMALPKGRVAAKLSDEGFPSKYSVDIYNLAFGAASFTVSDEDDVEDLKASLSEVLDEVKKKIKEYRADENAALNDDEWGDREDVLKMTDDEVKERLKNGTIDPEDVKI